MARSKVIRKWGGGYQSPLIDKDISEVGGYGPCAWRNNHYGERWVDLQMSCPVSGCPSTAVINQTHTCGGQVEVSNQARVRCQRCGAIDRIRNWNFSCSNHGGNGDGHTDIVSFTDALIAMLVNGDMDRSIATELLQNLRNSW